MSNKTFVLDTNVLLNDPRAIYQFGANKVVIPINVLEEVDQFKKELSERGRNARTISRYLDDLRAHGGHLSIGVELETGGTLQVAMPAKKIPVIFRDRGKQDNYILAVALEVAEESGHDQTTFITKDVNLRVRADALGLRAEDFEADKIDIEELYSGSKTWAVDATTLESFRAHHFVDAPHSEDHGFMANEFIMLQDEANPKNTALGRYDAVQKRIVPLLATRDGVWGIHPRNKEQQYALDLLLNDDIQLVTLVGKAGTGKTLLAIAAGLQKVADDKNFVKLLVSRPIFPLGRDMGYLPGDVQEKLNPWMQPIFDNVELLLGAGKSGQQNKKKSDGYKTLIDMGYMQIEPLTYIRGRSIPNQYMIVDEAQNLTPHEVKTIITRAGDRTKIVLTGDAYQIDNPYVDSANNGLTYVVERFKKEPVAGHITLVKGERSPLAELAANLL
ncbi:MAG: PhoH family protein [Deltaproteobacteria bacterium]|nr:PhoH family protein [Deltaproteobacteria bacterium]